MKGVQAVIFSADKKKILLLQRSDIFLWTLPGGRIDQNENDVDALKREVFEETGLIVKKATFYKTFKIWFWPFAGTALLYVCDCEGATIKTDSESINIKYFPINDLPILILPYIRSRIRSVLSSFNNTNTPNTTRN